MKSLYKSALKVSTALAVALTLGGCNDDFMNRYPETSITEPQFFKTVNDLEIYTNGMYGYMGPSYWEPGTDDVYYIAQDVDLFELMNGLVSPQNTSTWSWSNIRNVNFMLARADQATGDEALKNHYIGVARMWRAKLYYDKVKLYNDVPWYDTDISSNDTEALYKTQDPRSMVVDKIIEDLNFAVENIQSGNNKTLVHKDVARMLLASIALHEGTYRKYHDEIGLNDGDKYLEIAYQTAKTIIDEGNYSISHERNGEYQAYESLFNNTNLSSNPEVIFMRDYDNALNVKHNATSCFNWMSGMSRNLMEDYLYIQNGKAVAFHTIAGYDKMDAYEVFENRDPRMEQTMMRPGYIRTGSSSYSAPNLNLGGFPQVKFQPTTEDQMSWGKAYTDLPIFRYAETLLIYAEAKAELGILTQADIDMTIQPLRDRVGMPSPMLSDWAVEDKVQSARYPNVVSSQKGAVLEIRRERRIEMSCEGRRKDDLYRWKCGQALTVQPEGSYIPKLGRYDIDRDGKDDVAIYATRAEVEALPDDQKTGITVIDLENASFRLSNGTSGHVMYYQMENTKEFKEPAYYYSPMSTEDILYNPNLKQTIGWE